MTIYIDGLLLLNFAFDFLLLLATSIALKRKSKIFNLLLGAFIGSLTILILFLKINSLQLFIIKVYLSIIMNLVSFGYKDIKYTCTNIGIFYIISILLGGFLYLLNIEFSYKHKGLVFYHDSLSVNIIVLIIISPIILYIYIRQAKHFQKKVKNYYNLSLIIGNKRINAVGYLDSGNTLTYKGKAVIITNIPNTFKKRKFSVFYKTIEKTSILECIQAKAIIDELGTFDVYLGFGSFNISGANVLLNNKMEGK